MKKMQVNSPEYQKMVNSLLGKETKFEDVPQIPQKEKISKSVTELLKQAPKKATKKTVIALPKQAPKKAMKKKFVEKNEEKIYLLFKISEFGNSDDYAYELDYAFRGAYHSVDAAMKAAAISIVEQEDDDELENELFDEETGNLIVKNLEDNALFERDWKILVTDID